MKTCERMINQMLSAYYKELSNEESDAFEHHLAGCSDCASAFEQLNMELGAFKQKFHPQPAPDLEQRLWQNLQPLVSHQGGTGRLILIKQYWQNIFNTRHFRYGLAVAATMLIVGILIGKYLLPEIGDHTGMANKISEQNASFVRAEKYIDRSKVLLLGILNHDPADRTGLVNQKRISKSLIKEAAVLKEDLNHPGGKVLAHLVNELEVILLQIASLEAEYDLDSVQLIQSGIERKGLLFKINVNQVLTETNREVQNEQRDKIDL